MKFGRSIFLFLLWCLPLLVTGQEISVIPVPVQVQYETGTFTLSANTPVVVEKGQPEIRKAADYLVNRIRAATGYALDVVPSGERGILLSLDPKADSILDDEGYTLTSTGEKVVIRARTPAGIFYGIQTLLQLFPEAIESNTPVPDIRWDIPALHITDYPRFRWRGIMLDVSRHFFPKAYIKEFIDQIARYKFNRFHWHLTDDNGWRVEIKSLPRLTEVGAWRVPRTGTFNTHEPPRPGEKATDGGFYTQEDIREIVQYAKERYIEIIPEIDVPGHSMAAIASYPELCVTRDTSIRVNPGTAFATWHGNGRFTMHIDNTLNPADENVYRFLDKVFTEIASLFPYEYIHIGGDECYKGYWERDPGVQAFMKKNKIPTVEALQGYFTKRVCRILKDKNKKAIGWDEILEGDLIPGTAVMSWHGTKRGIEAARLKHPVVMSPSPTWYLDLMQGDPAIEPPVYRSSRLKALYLFDPLPEGIDSTYVLGGQGNLWSEQIPTTRQIEYMAYPRALAVAETLWSPRPKKNYNHFIQRVEKHFERLDHAQRYYATSMYDPIITVKKEASGQLIIEMDTEVEGLDLHYSVDNTLPGRYHEKYEGPIHFPEGADMFRVISYRNGKPVGHLITLTTEALENRVKK